VSPAKKRRRSSSSAKTPPQDLGPAEPAEKVMFVLPTRQTSALRTEALRRAVATGSMKPNASGVLREILDGELDPAKVVGKAKR
jgi:hypothetical protein